MNLIRKAPFALRVVLRQDGRAAIVYRRMPDLQGRDRLRRLAALSPLAYTASLSMLREAVKLSSGSLARGRSPHIPPSTLHPGSFYPLDADWGARLACFAFVSSGLSDAERLRLAAQNLRNADANEAAWWLGLLMHGHSNRALRALRILTEAVQ